MRNNVPFKRNITDMGAVCVLFKLVYRDLLAVQSIKFYDITGSLGEKKKGDLITDSLLKSATWNGKWSCKFCYLEY